MQQLELLFGDEYSLQRCYDTSPENKKVRQLKIHQGPYRDGRSSFPMLRLHGKWLAQAGFTVGSMVTIEVEEGQLIIKRIKV